MQFFLLLGLRIADSTRSVRKPFRALAREDSEESQQDFHKILQITFTYYLIYDTQ